jgi:hypothetical protein
MSQSSAPGSLTGQPPAETAPERPAGGAGGSLVAIFTKQLVVSIGLAGVVVSMLLAFGLSAIHANPHGLRIGVSGPQAATAQITAALNRTGPNYNVTTYPDEAAMAAAIKNRDIYGGFVAAPGALRVLDAPAAGATVATALSTAGYTLGNAAGAKVSVVSVVPFPPDDPRGAGFTAAALPLVIGGILPALIFMRLFPASLRSRVGGALIFSLAGGLAVEAVLDFWFGTVAGHFWPAGLGISLGMVAIALPFLGMDAWLGNLGFVIMIGLVMILGNALSGLASGPDWLPAGWGTLGQYLPPGASGSLLRSVAYFDGKGALHPLIVLICWVLGGYILAASALIRGRRQRTVEFVPEN